MWLLVSCFVIVVWLFCDCGVALAGGVVVWLCTNSCGVLLLHKWRWRRLTTEVSLAATGPSCIASLLLCQLLLLLLPPVKTASNPSDIEKVTTSDSFHSETSVVSCQCCGQRGTAAPPVCSCASHQLKLLPINPSDIGKVTTSAVTALTPSSQKLFQLSAFVVSVAQLCQSAPARSTANAAPCTVPYCK